MAFNLSIAFHIIGVVMWIGGMMILTRFLKIFCEEGTGRESLISMVKRVYFGFIVGGFAVALASGLFQLLYRGPGYYFSQGWFHGKLTFVIIMMVVTAIIGADIKKISNGQLLSKGKVGAMHGISGAVLLIVVILTIVGRT